MTKDQLHELAQWGVRRKLQEIEAELATYQEEFPDLFISETRIVLLKAEPRADGANVFLPPAPKRLSVGEIHQDNKTRLLAYLAESPLQHAVDIATALNIPKGSISGLLFKLKKKRQVWQPLDDSRWSVREKLRQKYLALPPSSSTVVANPPALVKLGEGVRPNGRPRITQPGGIAGKLRQFLARGGSYTVPDLAQHLKAKLNAVRSALERERRYGAVVNEGGAWRALAAPGPPLAPAQPGLPLVGAERPAAGKRPKLGAAPGSKRWKERWYVHLQANGPQRGTESARLLGTSVASLVSCAEPWLKQGILQRVEPGVFAVGSVKPAPGVLKAAAAAFDASSNGHGATA